MKIAVVNADATLSKIVNTSGYSTIIFNIENELHNLGNHDQIDMLIIDNVDTSTAKLIAAIKAKYTSVFPILLIANRHFADEEIVHCLVAGASDYIIKPLRRDEVITRMEVLLQQAYPNRVAVVEEFGDYKLNIRSETLSLQGQHIELTKKEFELALFLFRHAGQPLSRATILNAVWSHEPDIPSRTLDTHISRVRTKLKLQDENRYQLVPVYGFGYQLLQAP